MTGTIELEFDGGIKQYTTDEEGFHFALAENIVSLGNSINVDISNYPFINLSTSGQNAPANLIQVQDSIDAWTDDTGAVFTDDSGSVFEQAIVSPSYLTFVTGSSGYQQVYVDSADLIYDPATNTLTAFIFKGNLQGNADTATLSANSELEEITEAIIYWTDDLGNVFTDDALDPFYEGVITDCFLSFVPINSGFQPLYVDSSNLTYNAVTNTLTAVNFVGTFIGTATNADNVKITDDTTTNATMYIPWFTTNTGYLPTYVSSSKLTFNPFSGTLTAQNLNLPTTSGPDGQLKVNNTTQLHFYGTRNIFLGQGSGNFTLTPASAFDNIGIGLQTLRSLTTGPYNIAIGSGSCFAITTGNENTAIGESTLAQLISGVRNLTLGAFAGFSYTGSESSNICLENTGVVGESNVIRIGTPGTGTGLQNKAYMAGIYGVTPSSATTQIAIISDGHQLGSAATVPASNITITDDVTTNASMNLTWVNGNSGNLPVYVSSTKLNFNPSTGTLTPQNLNLPLTTTTTGFITINNNIVFSAYGTAPGLSPQNLFVGFLCGNTTLNTSTAVVNFAFGGACLRSLTTGNRNNTFGSNGLELLTTGAYNLAAGYNPLSLLLTGSYNTAIAGFRAGVNYTSNESSNVLLGSEGVTGDNNIMRLGTHGTGNGQQNACYIAGIYNTSVGATAGVVLSDSTHKLGGLAGVAGTVFIGGTSPSFTATPSITSLTTTGTTEATIGGAGTITTAGGIYATKAIINGSTTDASSITTGAFITPGGAAVGKKLYVGTGIYLPTSGGTAAQLDYYAKTTHSTTLTGVWASDQNIAFYLQRIDGFVDMTWHNVYTTANTAAVITVVDALPVGFRPAADAYFTICTISSGANQVGTMKITSAGVITIYNGTTFGNFSGVGFCGPLGGGVTFGTQ